VCDSPSLSHSLASGALCVYVHYTFCPAAVVLIHLMEQGAERGPARVKFASHLFHAMARSAAARDGWVDGSGGGRRHRRAPSHRRIALIQSAPTNNFVSISKCAADASLQLQTEEREKRALLVSHPSVRLYMAAAPFFAP
jgi:hypothetical protein